MFPVVIREYARVADDEPRDTILILTRDEMAMWWNDLERRLIAFPDSVACFEAEPVEAYDVIGSLN